MNTICKHCGTVNGPANTLPGSGWIELILWLAWLVPGIIYSVWRRSSRTAPACRACGHRDLVPADSPVGRALMPAGPPAVVRRVRPPTGWDVGIHRITVVVLCVLGLALSLPLLGWLVSR